MQLEVMMGSKGQKHPYSFKPCHRCKCFLKVQSFNLCVSLCHQSCLVACHHAIFILLVAKNPSTRVYTWFLSKLLSSSCIAKTQSSSTNAFSILSSSIEETKEKSWQKLAKWDRVNTPVHRLPRILSVGWFLWIVWRSLGCFTSSWSSAETSSASSSRIGERSCPCTCIVSIAARERRHYHLAGQQ